MVHQQVSAVGARKLQELEEKVRQVKDAFVHVAQQRDPNIVHRVPLRESRSAERRDEVKRPIGMQNVAIVERLGADKTATDEK